MKIEEEARGSHTIVKILGTLALGENTRMLQERFEEIESERTGAVILDLSGLEHLDSTAVGVLVGGLKRFDAQGRRFFLVNPRERVASVFRITHLDSIFKTFPNVQTAIEAANLPGEEATSGH